jgi:hypothetical protein
MVDELDSFIINEKSICNRESSVLRSIKKISGKAIIESFKEYNPYLTIVDSEDISYTDDEDPDKVVDDGSF